MAGLSLLLALAGPAPTQRSAIAQTRPTALRPVDPRLAKGVNLSHWFANSFNGYGDGHLSSFVTDADAQIIRRARFTHVRLPVSMELALTPGPVGKAFVSKLVEKVSMLNGTGLAVIVAIYATEEEKRNLLDPAKQSAFIEGWRSLAQSLAPLKQDLVLLELLNEPYPLVGAQWWPVQNRVAEAVRKIASRNTFIASPGNWSSVTDYTAEFSPVPDSNVVYTAHVYHPVLFTHQGANWSWEVAAQVAGVEWPLSAAVAPVVAAHSGNTEEAVKQLHYQIGEHQFEAGWLANSFGKLTEWQKKAGSVPMYVGEFGVYRPVAPTSSRLRWHKEAREAFEARGWGWAVWDYAGGFAIAQSIPPYRTLDQAMLEALGLWEPIGRRR
jgi:endoglucanase